MEFISHCIKDKTKGRFGDRAMIGVLCILAAFALLGWIYLSQASHVAMTSRRVQDLEDQKKQLQEQNLELMAQIAEYESVRRLAERAEALGFVRLPLDEVQFLAVAEPKDRTMMLADASPAQTWWAQVAAQFAAWAQTGSP
ncbi:MAG: hypothetical protein JW934_23270 [Anaerolineae bacterium]|nr:hypothetical protein [Anaerolineae bacterium]